MNPKTKSVLFVCLGNICRSPTGEGVMRALVAERDLESEILIDSAGTIGYHEGKPADARMRAAASRRDIELLSRSRKLVPTDLETFDLVLAMDRENLADIKQVHASPTAEVRLFSEFLDEDWPTDVPDPYYGGADGFETVLDMIQAGCPQILEHLRS
jgi:protein-tyrosine phosphatase